MTMGINTVHTPPWRGSKAFSVTLQRGRGTILDQLLVILWLLCIPLEFPLASAFRYPVTLLVLVSAVIHWRDVAPVLRRGAFFFLLPAVCLLSVLWSEAPLLSVRFGTFMAITLFVCAYTGCPSRPASVCRHGLPCQQRPDAGQPAFHAKGLCWRH